MTTYVYIDVIGIKKKLKSNLNEAKKELEKFWKKMDVYANNIEKPLVRKTEEKDIFISPHVYVDVFSDSAIIHCEPEVEFDDFYEKLLKQLKEHLNGISFYCIISIGNEIKASKTPVLGGYLLSSSDKPYWHQIAGSGEVWINIWIAEDKIKKMKKWRDKYSLYIIGNFRDETLEKIKKEEIGIKSFDGNKVNLYACDW